MLYKERTSQNLLCAINRDPEDSGFYSTASFDHRPSTALASSAGRLLRKEVIQPQVPLRLPCYDFVPITSLTLGRRPPCGLANALRAKPAFMT